MSNAASGAVPAAAGPTQTGRLAARLRLNRPTSTRQTMSVRDRQELHSVREFVTELEKKQPGMVHEVKLMFGRRGMSAAITLDRNRDGASGTRDAAKAGEAAHTAAKPAKPSAGKAPTKRTPQQTQPMKAPPQQRPPQQQPAGGHRPPAPSRAAPPAAAKRAYVPVSDQEAHGRLVVTTIKEVITAVVRARDGDETTGGQLLQPKRSVVFGSYQCNNLRVPTGSHAANMSAADFADEVESLLMSVNSDKEGYAFEEALFQLLTPGIDYSRPGADGASAMQEEDM